MLNVINEVFKMVGARMKDSFLDTYVDIAEDVPRFVKGDSIRLRQALLNYAANAVKFTEHGSITLRAKMLEEVGQRLLVRFEVEDTGIGIAPDVIPQLFQAFEQAYNAGYPDGHEMRVVPTSRLLTFTFGAALSMS